MPSTRKRRARNGKGDVMMELRNEARRFYSRAEMCLIGWSIRNGGCCCRIVSCYTLVEVVLLKFPSRNLHNVLDTIGSYNKCGSNAVQYTVMYAHETYLLY